MTEAILIIVGLAAGGVLAWFAASMRAKAAHARECADLERRASGAEGIITELRTQVHKASDDFGAMRATYDGEREKRVTAETKLAENTRYLEQREKDLDKRFTDTFTALSNDALKSSNKQFLQLAHESIQKIVADAKGDLGKRQEAIDGVVKPLQESLKRYEDHVKSLETSRQRAYGSLEEQLRTLTATHQQLQKETGKLATALTRPEVRGRWGEITLKRVVELAGMSEYCDYYEQVSVDTEEGRLRPDMIVKLPADRQIVVDAKVSLNAYLEATAAESEEQRAECMERHAQQVRTHMVQLASKKYWEQFESAPDFVVMFIPGESFFAAALDCDQELMEDSFRKRVLMATPTTLIGMLRTIAYGWRQEQVAKSALEISSLGKQLYERLGTLAEHINTVGKNLGRTNEAFNKAVASMEARVFPSARRFKELGTTAGDEIPPVEPIDTVPRALTAPEAPDDPPDEAETLFGSQ